MAYIMVLRIFNIVMAIGAGIFLLRIANDHNIIVNHVSIWLLMAIFSIVLVLFCLRGYFELVI